jgi:uroporphyrinogen-III synthase
LAAAEAMGLGTAFVDALQCDVVAVAVGPVTAGPLADAGIRVIYPDRHRLGALIRLVCEHLDQHRVERFVNGANVIELRGRALTINGERILLGPNALALFKALAAADGVIARSALLQVLPDEPDDHALEVAVSRLRRALGIDGLISTVVKRGYRLNAERVGGLD